MKTLFQVIKPEFHTIIFFFWHIYSTLLGAKLREPFWTIGCHLSVLYKNAKKEQSHNDLLILLEKITLSIECRVNFDDARWVDLRKSRIIIYEPDRPRLASILKSYDW